MRLRYAIAAAFVSTTFAFLAAAIPVHSAVIDTAHFINDSDEPVLIEIQKASRIGNEQVCLEPNQSDSSHFIQKVSRVLFLFRNGGCNRMTPLNAYPGGGSAADKAYKFFEPETTYTVRGKHGSYSVSVSH